MPPRGGFGLSLSSGRDVKPRREDRPAGGLLARRLGYLLQAPYPPRVHPMCTPPVSQPGKPVLREERYGIFLVHRCTGKTLRDREIRYQSSGRSRGGREHGRPQPA